MAHRIQIVVTEEERERFRRCARSHGQSLSAWMRTAARERAEAGPERRFSSAEEVRSFFERSNRAAGSGPEPEWEEHLETLERSIRGGVDAP